MEGFEQCKFIVIVTVCSLNFLSSVSAKFLFPKRTFYGGSISKYFETRIIRSSQECSKKWFQWFQIVHISH